MKLFKVFLSFFVFAALVFLVSLFFPHQYKIEEKISIHKPRDSVFLYMNNLRNWESWSLWNRSADSTLGYFYGKRSDSTGARQYFYGQLLKTGRFMISESVNGEKIVYQLYMHQGDVNASGTFLFKGENDGMELSWLDSGDVGYNPFLRFMIPSKTKSTSEAFQSGLERIKARVEYKQ